MPQKVVVVEPGKDLPVIGPVPAALTLLEGVGSQILQMFLSGVRAVLCDLPDVIFRGGIGIGEVFVEPEEVFPVPVGRTGFDVDVDEGSHPAGVCRRIETCVQGPHRVPQQDHVFQAERIDEGRQIKHIIAAPVGRRNGPAAFSVPALIECDDPEVRRHVGGDQIPRVDVVPGAVKKDHGPCPHRALLKIAKPQTMNREVVFFRVFFGCHRSLPSSRILTMGRSAAEKS
jgi:hypothetical protein